eukprot:TRINITY_DN93245_c0_g1_i1.p1 TRINITY_DN93245_c0_g1~~TRINITY_DN93245_c0_g1_i1.p1  ORF type:complete len:116 (-),score=14.78 TRINITY_DN93245_c0_g1_i1:62-385(-)
MKKDTTAPASGDYPKKKWRQSLLCSSRKSRRRPMLFSMRPLCEPAQQRTCRRRQKANKAWIQEKYPIMNAMQYFTDFMSELFDERDKHHTPDLDVQYYKGTTSWLSA